MAPLAAEIPREELMKCLRREYVSFFDPLEPEFYREDVTFDDPLSTLSGIGAYRDNVDMLAGRTAIGKILFKDASIALHSVTPTGEKKIRTRWTLRVTFGALPWKPVARFTGASDYDLDDSGKVQKQTDYWDSIDLKNGDYERSSKLDGLKDFIDQVTGSATATDEELPYELLRRAKDYAVRRYPATKDASVYYEVRPEGYDLLGSYAGGYNEEKRKLNPFAPSVIKVPRQSNSKERKSMRWPLTIDSKATLPEPSTTAIELTSTEETVFAVMRFKTAATQESVAFYTQQLEKRLREDGLQPAPGSDAFYTVAQFDAIFSVGDRRNEIWIPIDVPAYWQLK